MVTYLVSLARCDHIDDQIYLISLPKVMIHDYLVTSVEKLVTSENSIFTKSTIMTFIGELSETS